jgi:hypothetical protein
MPRKATPTPKLHWDNVAPGPFNFDGAPEVWPVTYVFRVSPFADAIQLRVTQDGITAALVPCPRELRGRS